MRAFLRSYRYPLLIASLANFLVSPLWDSTMTIHSSLIVVISFTLIILAGINVTGARNLRFWVLLIGTGTLVCIWVEYGLDWLGMMSTLRILLSLSLFLLLFCVLILNIIRTKEICMEMIVAVMSGFLFLGIIGGVVYELLELVIPNSLAFSASTGNYGFYYFSFISLTSVGFGDIVPQTALAQAVTVLMGVLGQFYLAFGVTVFVGKYLNQQSNV